MQIPYTLLKLGCSFACSRIAPCVGCYSGTSFHGNLGTSPWFPKNLSVLFPQKLIFNMAICCTHLIVAPYPLNPWFYTKVTMETRVLFWNIRMSTLILTVQSFKRGIPLNPLPPIVPVCARNFDVLKPRERPYAPETGFRLFIAIATRSDFG